jgi:DNA-binding NarL/FixJ family response regulator
VAGGGPWRRGARSRDRDGDRGRDRTTCPRHRADDAIADRLDALATRCDGVLVETYAADGRARVADDPAALDDVSQRFEAMGADLHAAEAAAVAARHWRLQGRRAAALASRERSRELLARCGDPVSPALAAIDDVDPLTPREREVALLAASGLASRAIAERLHLSVRTVESHLERIYHKLGLRGRYELIAAFRTDPHATP